MDEISEGLMLDEVQENARLRLACLELACKRFDGGHLPVGTSLLEQAEDIYDWVSKRTPATIKIVAVGDVTTQQEDEPMQIHDNQQFTVTIEVDDAKGFAIQDDQLTVTSADESVATVQDQGNGTYLIVAGNPGSTVITFDAGTDDNGNQVTATEAVDVVPGNVATIKLVEGDVSTQGAAQAPADGGDGTQPTA